MKLHSITVLPDNYIWLLSDHNNDCVIVDPGVAQPVIDYIESNHLITKAILLTHHHADHINGTLALLAQYPDCVIYAPQEITNLANFSTLKQHQIRQVNDTDQLVINDFNFRVMALPGHTSGHVAFYQPPFLFCGDTLFSAGCGRIFEGSPTQMFSSLMKLSQLPDQTLVCCGHEYTLSNLKFAHNLLPDDPMINLYIARTEILRAQMEPTVPSTLKVEKQINLFLRTSDKRLQKALGYNSYHDNYIDVFTKLRKLKDNY